MLNIAISAARAAQLYAFSRAAENRIVDAGLILASAEANFWGFQALDIVICQYLYPLDTASALSQLSALLEAVAVA